MTSTLEQHRSPASKAVLLQGPVGPFFSRLQQALDEAGWSTVKINFNGGDRTFHGKGQEISFTGKPEDWARFIEGVLKNFDADVILMFGDQRPIHRQSREIARRLGVKAVCFEEGYLRPDFITMELGGNNAASALRRWRPGRTVEADTKEDGEALTLMPNNGFHDMARYAARYFLTMWTSTLSFPYYQHHRQRGIVRESLMWCRNAIRKWNWRYKNLQAIQNIVEKLDKRYFIVALQVHDDLQLRRHGCGWTNEKLIENAVASFSHHANRNHHLVFKGHPLDRGHTAGRDFTRKVSILNGVEDRVHYIDDGSLGLLSRHSRGMVTVNSTSAMLSFEHGNPVVALGDSFYEGLTLNPSDRSVAALDRFWTRPPVSAVNHWSAFRTHMLRNGLINGSFYIESEISPTCQRVVARLNRMLETQVRPALPSAASTAGVGAAAFDAERQGAYAPAGAVIHAAFGREVASGSAKR